VRADFAMRVLCPLLFLIAGTAFAQSGPDEFQVKIKFGEKASKGRFVTDRSTAKLNLSDRYKMMLRPGVTNEQLIAEFCDALDREFRTMPAPYFYTLKTDEQKLDRAGRLTDAKIEELRQWDRPIERFPAIGDLNLFRNNRGLFGSFNDDVEKVSQRSALAVLLNPDDGVTEPFQFQLRDPLIVNTLDTPTLGNMLNRDGVLSRLRSLDGLPANPERIQAAIIDFYIPRGVTPKITLNLTASPPSIAIFETSRIQRILLPKELTDFSIAGQLVYESLPHRVFEAFRKKGRDELARTIDDPDVTKREIDLTDLVNAAESETEAQTFIPPPIDASLLAQIQQRLLQLGYTASLFDFAPAEQKFDLVLDSTTPQPHSGSEASSVMGTAESQPNAPETTARPGAQSDLQPAPVAPAPSVNPQRKGNTPRQQQKHFLGGGFEYKPGQNIRALATYQFASGVNLIGMDVGGAGSGFGSGHYSRNYLLFDTLGRPLSADISGGTDYERQRILDNVPTNERRTGGALRLDLELFRDWDGQNLSIFAEGRYESVRLTAADPETAPRPETLTNLSTMDVGSSYDWRRSLMRHPFTLRVEPSLRFGLGLSSTEPNFQKLRLGVQFHVSIAGPIEAETRFQARTASDQTPVFELPSLGGGESVRGFRTDESLGGRLWASQNELWFPILGHGPSSKLRDFIRRDVRIAMIYDAGVMHRLAPGLPASLEGFRHGAGIGLRVRYQGVGIEADWAVGFGDADTGRPAMGRFYFNFRLP